MDITKNKLFSALKDLGVDIEGTLSRFVDDDEIYTKFLARFPDEDRITPIREAAAAADLDALMRTAHKLKGVTANLGMNTISQKAEKIVSKLRNGVTGGFEADIEDAAQEYELICKTILENR